MIGLGFGSAVGFGSWLSLTRISLGFGLISVGFGLAWAGFGLIRLEFFAHYRSNSFHSSLGGPRRS